MHITSEPQEWTPIDPNLENELLNAYARIAELEELQENLKGNCRILIKKLNASSDLRYWELKVVRAPISNGQPRFRLHGKLKTPLSDSEFVGDQLHWVEIVDKSTATSDVLAQLMLGVVLKTIKDQKRPGGLLSK